MEDIVYWIWLSLACTPDTATFPRLIAKFGDAKTIYDADIKKIASAIDPRSSDRTALADKDLEQAQSILAFARKYDVGLVPYCSEKYPKSLRSIPTPPVLLYYRGTFPDFSSVFPLAVVGNRELSEYGRKNAFKLAYDLASSGAVIVSGMAKGIDSVAHAAALAAGKTTVAVIGSGINICYPEEHRHLARSIVKNGCVITEYPPGAKPSRSSFPRRNRIISGLSRATLVIEGRERSGALTTARHAEKQKRPIYALPGNVGSPNSFVTNLLLKDGARLCTQAEDIIKDFEKEIPSLLNPFALKERLPVDMHATLAEYKVVAICPNDNIFIPPRSNKQSAQKVPVAIEKPITVAETERIAVKEEERPVSSFGKDELVIYKRIPLEAACAIEDLADKATPIWKVMKCLSRLEAGGFVTVLPGELVERKKR